MRILALGDVVGKPGRRAIEQLVPQLRAEHRVDMVVANGENSAGGLGITFETAQEMFRAGVDVLTSGNHVWAKREIIPYLDGELPIIRPLNFPPGAPGKGYLLYRGVLVVNLIGRVFMGNAVDDPFRAADTLLEQLPGRPPIVIVDFHCEATSEKAAFGWYLDGRVSAVLGTHTHVGTVDARILPKGTAYVTDIGMVGPRDSVIGNTVEDVVQRFLTAMPSSLGVPSGPVSLHSVLVEVDDKSGKALSIKRIDRTID